jgi:hypothetical protein
VNRMSEWRGCKQESPAITEPPGLPLTPPAIPGLPRIRLDLQI